MHVTEKHKIPQYIFPTTAFSKYFPKIALTLHYLRSANQLL